MIAYPIAIIVGYVIGAIPVGLLIGRLTKGVDIRQHGSGKIGTTNVLRTVGRPAAILVLLLDMGKGVSAVVIARIISDSVGVDPVAALAVLIGHNWPIFTGFRGGRGTAPGLGGLLILSPWAGLAAIVTGLPALIKSRYVSLGSLVGAAVGGLTLVVLSAVGVEPLPYMSFGIVAASTVILSHRDNIGRILHGTERKLGAPAEVLNNATIHVEKGGRGV